MFSKYIFFFMYQQANRHISVHILHVWRYVQCTYKKKKSALYGILVFVLFYFFNQQNEIILQLVVGHRIFSLRYCYSYSEYFDDGTERETPIRSWSILYSPCLFYVLRIYHSILHYFFHVFHLNNNEQQK